MSNAIFWMIIGGNVYASLGSAVRGEYGWPTLACDVAILALVFFYVRRRAPKADA
jgi:hypothetical protein